MEVVLMLIAALLPVAVLGYYIYKKDKLRQEPPKELLKAFGFGVLSIFVSLCIVFPQLGQEMVLFVTHSFSDTLVMTLF